MTMWILRPALSSQHTRQCLDGNKGTTSTSSASGRRELDLEAPELATLSTQALCVRTASIKCCGGGLGDGDVAQEGRVPDSGRS